MDATHYATALQLLDASNASGVLSTLEKMLPDLRKVLHEEGTEAFNTHPVLVVILHKLCQLAHIETDIKSFSVAYVQCRQESV